MVTVIGISGVSGAGKSTLGTLLSEKLKAVLIEWDDFDEISLSPDDYIDWYKRGRNYDEWDYCQLADTLQTLKLNHCIVHPVNHWLLTPSEYIIFPAPLGRLHRQTGQYIDICIHIAVPMDVSLCRRLLREGKNKTKSEILYELECYLNEARPLFYDSELKNSADFIIDGMSSPEHQI